jgi:hypothetical protein
MNIRLCEHCQQPLGPKKRADARFCDDSCRSGETAEDRKERNRVRHAYERSIPIRFAAWLRRFEQRVREHAPENALGYQAGLWLAKDSLWLPVVIAGHNARGQPRTRRTFDGRRSDKEYFPLDPFEPPCVPLATHYTIRFVSRIFPHPHLDELGSFVEVIPFEFKLTQLPVSRFDRLPTSKMRR